MTHRGVARLLTILLFVVGCLLTHETLRGQQPNTLQLHFLDVGQADATVLVSPGGEVVLFDSGAAGDCGKPLAYLQALGLTKIDYHIATSYAPGHLGCAPEIFELFPLTQAAFDPGEGVATSELARYASAVGAKRQAVSAGRRITLDARSANPVTIDLLAASGIGLLSRQENARNLVAVVRYGGFAAEIGGDVTGAMEDALADRVGPVDVYRVHDHASRDSASARWLSIVKPRIGIVSTSVNNAERTPNAEAITRLHEAGVTTYWTSLGNGVSPETGRDLVAGNIVVEVATDATSFTVRSSAQSDRFGTSFDREAVSATRAPVSFSRGASSTSATSTSASGPQELTITTFAGTPGSAGSSDGSRALFRLPQATAVDATGVVYVADASNHTIRKIATDGIVTTFAGSAGQRGTSDGTGAAARFDTPIGVAVDSTSTVYVADNANHTIRRISPSGVVSTLAGSPQQAGSADGVGGVARFNQPGDVAVDPAGNIYVADSGNHTIRKIAPGAIVTTLAGTAGQAGLADGTGSVARFSRPGGVAADSAGAVYVADFSNQTIRKITPAGVVTTLAGTPGQTGSADGTGSAARFAAPSKLAADTAANVYVADQMNHTIRKITSGGVVTTVAGSAGLTGSADGTGAAARFYQPIGIAVDSVGAAFVADYANSTIRKVTAAGQVTTLAGLPGKAGATDGSGTGATAKFSGPVGIAVDQTGTLYVSDSNNSTIRRVTPEGAVTTLAGTAGQRGSTDGVGAAARFSFPSGIAAGPAQTVYVADRDNHIIRRIDSTGVVTTLAGFPGQAGSADGTGGAARFNFPTGIAVDAAGTVYVADRVNQTIRKMTSSGVVTTLAGSPGLIGNADGTGAAARFNFPVGLVVDAAGTVYVADSNNHTVRRISSAGVVTTLAGNPGQAGFVDGTGTAARMSSPQGLAVDAAGTVYAVTGNHSIRRITAAGVVTTPAGSNTAGFNDGTGVAARFNFPQGIAVDALGVVYVADTFSHTIRKGIRSTPWSDLPFGSFDTPTTGSTGAGEVAVTGWSLDDEGVATVDVYRSPSASESTAPPGIYIGTANFVNGARPDLAGAYPTLPNNTRAGWGYMLLTNFLTDGSLTLSAYAKDTEGQTTSLGTKTLIVNNTASVKPFGTIDTPGQGDTVSGVVTNFGWALTPKPNTIPVDGSTIDVYVDNVLVGHPVYNNYRVDIATLFPGYNNSNGAVGYFSLDTRTLTNGVHTISWVVRDNAGNAQGVGSRYFTVQNPAS